MKLKSSITKLGAAILTAATLSGCGTISAMSNLEDGAFGEFMTIWDRWVESKGDIAYATTWDAKLLPGVTEEAAVEGMEEVAIYFNLRNVGSLPLSKELEARGVKTGVISVNSYCNPGTARKMMDFTMHAGAFLPCRVTLGEDANGDMYAYTLNMDMMIKMGKKQPKELLPETYRVRNGIKAMLYQAASGGNALDVEALAEEKDGPKVEAMIEKQWKEYLAYLEKEKATAKK
jgi:uncharacterized protein (DUF302 family)